LKNSKKVLKRDKETKEAQIEIENIVWGGKGIGRIDGKVYFIPKSVPQDRLLIKVTKEKKDYGYGEIVKIIYPSPYRVSPLCKDFKRCGGCQIQMMNYKLQVESKEKMAKEILRRWLNKAKFNSLLAMENPFEYRHSGEFHIKWMGEKCLCGFYEGESHKVVDFENCYLFPKGFNSKIKGIKNFVYRKKIEGISSFNLSSGENEEGYIATFLVGENDFDLKDFENIQKEVDLNGVVVKSKNGVEILRKGECFLTYTIKKREELLPEEIKFKVDVESFTQANFQINAELVYEVLRLANLSSNETVLELFSGAGNFTLPLAMKCKEVTAVEKCEKAIEDSKFNANLNSLHNVKHLKGDVKEQIRKLISTSEKYDLVLLDPPRGGAYEIIEGIAAFNPKRVLYISCNLPTLERDLRRLNEFGFFAEEFSFFDLFPHTYGVETAVLLRSKNDKN